MTGWRRYLLDALVVVLTAGALLIGWTLWVDHVLLRRLAQIEVQRQQRGQQMSPAPRPAQPPQ